MTASVFSEFCRLWLPLIPIDFIGVSSLLAPSMFCTEFWLGLAVFCPKKAKRYQNGIRFGRDFQQTGLVPPPGIKPGSTA
jgi:hypothetical protein